MHRLLAILSILTALAACSGEPPIEREVYAWSVDGMAYWEGQSAAELSAVPDATEKALRHRNGHNQGNTGVQGSCGSLASSSVWCRLRTEDKGVWAYTHPGTSGYVFTGMDSGENSLIAQGVDVTNARMPAQQTLRSRKSHRLVWTG